MDRLEFAQRIYCELVTRQGGYTELDARNAIRAANMFYYVYSKEEKDFKLFEELKFHKPDAEKYPIVDTGVVK